MGFYLGAQITGALLEKEQEWERAEAVIVYFT